ncbi:TonB-dependent receptor [Sphingomonas sp. GB1N7]|uniref:TonB-dependent receptor n=1 Tax=Parasphingomonas caseinilytica TaxID=3096158 RepID=UPI002FC5ECC2
MNTNLLMRSVASTVAIIGCMHVNPVLSQVVEQSTDDTRRESDIVVNGNRKRTPIVLEREATGTIDVVATGDIALQSQTNIADLAKQLPGVSVSRDQGRNQSATGEAQYVAIRGFDTSYNAYTLDGMRLPQTAGSSRAISLNLFSPFAIGGIITDKTPGATKDADAIAGIVDLRTPTAFDFAEPLIRARVLTQAADLALKTNQAAWGGAVGLDAARRFGSDKQFGIYVAGYYEERSNAAESTSTQGEYRTTNAITAPATVRTAAASGAPLSADGIQWNFFNNRIKRYGGSASFDYRTDALDLYAHTNYAVLENTNTMNQTGLRSELTSGQSNPNPSTNPGGNQYNSAGVYTPYGINPASYFRVEDVHQDLWSNQIGIKLYSGGFTLSLEGGYADGAFNSPNRIEAAFRGVAYNGTATNTGVATEGLKIDLSNPSSPRPILSSAATAYISSLDRPTQLYVQKGYDYLREKKKTVKGSVGWNGEGVLAGFTVGGLYEDSDRQGRTLTGDPTRYRFLTPLQSGTVQGATVAAYPGEIVNSFLDYYPPRAIKLLDRAAVEAQAALYVPTIAVSQTTLNQGLTSGNETRKAAFASAVVKLGTVELVPGIRYEKNHFDGRFYQTQDGGRTYNFVSAGRDYDHVDPSLLATWRPTDRLVVRAAARSSYSRPAFDQLAGPTTISADGLTITQTNPNLKPVEAWSYDLGLEYYAASGRYFQVAAYHKDLKNIIVPTGTRNERLTGAGVTTIQPVNGLTGKATGVEASGRFMLGDLVGGGFLGGFGLDGNVTYQKTQANYRISATDLRRTSLPQAPDLIYNASLVYDAKPIRASLWYNHTGRRLVSVQDSQPDIYLQSVSELNLGLAWAINSHLELGASLRNLLDTPTYWATVGKEKTYISNDRNGGYIETGRVYQLSLTMTM